jgi:hypothetical protein
MHALKSLLSPYFNVMEWQKQERQKKQKRVARLNENIVNLEWQGRVTKLNCALPCFLLLVLLLCFWFYSSKKGVPIRLNII